MKLIRKEEHTFIISAEELINVLNARYNLDINKESMHLTTGTESVTIIWKDAIEEPITIKALYERRSSNAEHE